MTIDEAKAIMETMDEQFPSNYISAIEDGDTEVCLDGWFTAEQLEALAMWLRFPSQVCPRDDKEGSC